MAIAAAHTGSISHSTTLGGTYTAIDGIKSVAFPVSRDELDTTDFADASWRTFIMGLGTGEITLSGDRNPGNTQQDALQTAATAGTSVFLQFLPDGTNGFKGEFYVTSFEANSEVAGLASVSIRCRLTGAPTAVP